MQVVKGFYGLLRARGEEQQATAAKSLLQAFKRVSTEYASFNGPFFVGARLSVVDALLWPWIARLNVLNHYRAFSVPDEPEYAPFHRFVGAMRSRPAVQSTQCDDIYVAAYKSYAE